MTAQRIFAAGLLVALVSIQSWALVYVPKQAALMVSTFELGSMRCAVRPIAWERIVETAHQADPAATSTLSVEGRHVKVWSRLLSPSEALFRNQEVALRLSLDCGTSAWCEGKAPDADYGEAQLERLAAKRRGEAVDLQGCEVAEADFHSLSFEIFEPARRPFDLMTLLSVVIDLAALFLVLRGLWRWPAWPAASK